MELSIGICTAAAPSGGNEFQLFPAGAFRSQDGRPKGGGEWRMNAQLAARLIARFNATKNPMVVDYEHQTMLSKDNGRPAPAAGWVHRLEWREGKGLFAVDVKWTDAARASIQNDEYRYISPVFKYNEKTGDIIHLANAALTNNPALDGMEAAVALRQQLDAQSLELACLRREAVEREIDTVIDEARASAVLLPYQVEAARQLASSNLEALKTILKRPPLIDTVPQSERLGLAGNLAKGVGHSDLTCGLNMAELRMCQLTGRTPEEFAALKKQFGPESH